MNLQNGPNISCGEKLYKKERTNANPLNPAKQENYQHQNTHVSKRRLSRITGSATVNYTTKPQYRFTKSKELPQSKAIETCAAMPEKKRRLSVLKANICDTNDHRVLWLSRYHRECRG